MFNQEDLLKTLVNIVMAKGLIDPAQLPSGNATVIPNLQVLEIGRI